MRWKLPWPKLAGAGTSGTAGDEQPNRWQCHIEALRQAGIPEPGSAVRGRKPATEADEMCIRDSHQAVRNGPVHEIRRPVDLNPGEIGAVDQQVAFPLLMNGLAPPRPEAARQAEPHQEIPQWRGI